MPSDRQETAALQYEIVSDVSEMFTGTAKHIRLSEKVVVGNLLGEGTTAYTADFVISATELAGKPETYAFPANENGEVESMGEVISPERHVSQKGTLDIKKVADALALAAANEGLKG